MNHIFFPWCLYHILPFLFHCKLFCVMNYKVFLHPNSETGYKFHNQWFEIIKEHIQDIKSYFIIQLGWKWLFTLTVKYRWLHCAPPWLLKPLVFNLHLQKHNERNESLIQSLARCRTNKPCIVDTLFLTCEILLDTILMFFFLKSGQKS